MNEDQLETFLWSLCQADGADSDRRIGYIRVKMKRWFGEEYDTKCGAKCKDGSKCFQMVPNSRKRCYHHI